MAKDDILKEAQEAFKQAEDAEHDNRIAALEDLRFARLGEQWPEAIKRQRELENRPCLTNNKMPAFIRQVVNDSRQNKPSITFHPVEDGDVETAEVLNGLMRNIEYSSNADIAYDTAIDFAVSMGFGYIRVDTDYSYDDAFTQDIKILPVPNPFSVYGDPLSTSADGSDWKVAFVTDVLKEAAFKKQYPGAETANADGDHDALDWFGTEGIRIAEWWTKEDVPTKLLQLSDGMVMFEADYLKRKDIYDSLGLQVVGERDSKTCKVRQRIISGAEVLEDNDWAGKYIPIVPVYGDEVNIEGKRHYISLIRFAKDAQQMHNYWRTMSTELVALAPKAPFIGKTGSFDTDADKWATANTANHAYLEFDGDMMPQRQPFAGVPAGALQEALNAADDMKAIMGLYDASMGARSNETSGKAIMARQREGDVSTFHFIDNMTRAIRQVGRICGDLIPKIYSEERMIRVIGEDGSNDMVKVNAEYEDKDEHGNPMLKLHDLTAGKYDLIVKSGPSFTTRREEAAQQMMQLVQAFPDAAPLIGDLVAKNLDWPGAEEIAKRFKKMLPPQLQEQEEQPQIPPQVQQMIEQGQMQMQQMEQAIQQLQQENQQLQAEKASKQQDMALKQQDGEIKVRLAEIDERIKANELLIKEKELVLKEQELALKGQEMVMTEVEASRNNQQHADVTGMVTQMAQMMQMMSAPKKKSRAMKQPDGSFLLEQIEDEQHG
jgi:hypothetical protein